MSMKVAKKGVSTKTTNTGFAKKLQNSRVKNPSNKVKKSFRETTGFTNVLIPGGLKLKWGGPSDDGDVIAPAGALKRKRSESGPTYYYFKKRWWCV